MLSAQWLLLASMAVLYLYDSALWLLHDEVVLEARDGGYGVSGGSTMEFARRHLFLPNPFFPHRALARLSWPSGGSTDWRPAHWTRATLALSVVAPWTWLLLGLFFVALPLALAFGTHEVLLAWLILTYLGIVAMLVQVYRHRKVLGLAPGAVFALAADALLCAPFALNMVRKISLRQGAAASLHDFASSMLSADERVGLTSLLHDRIRVSLDHVEADSETGCALNTYLARYEDDMP